MTTLTEANQALRAVIAQIVADHTDFPLAVETSNRNPIDQALQTDPYLQVSIVPMGGGQLSLGENPLVKQDGQILLSAVAKDGSGEAAALALLDFVMPYFSCKQIGGVTVHAMVAQQAKPFGGWWYAPAMANYYFTKIS